jgi:hypothetical protein
MLSVCVVAKSAASTIISPLSLHVVIIALHRAKHAHSTARIVSLAVICTTWIIHEMFLMAQHVSIPHSQVRVLLSVVKVTAIYVLLSLGISNFVIMRTRRYYLSY